MAKAHQQGQREPGMVVGVVTPDGLDPALDQKRGALRALVNSLENITAEPCRGEKQSDIAITRREFRDGNIVLEV
ncbi:unnamed protein product, partial [marine sediment metagenome]